MYFSDQWSGFSVEEMASEKESAEGGGGHGMFSNPGGSEGR